MKKVFAAVTILLGLPGISAAADWEAGGGEAWSRLLEAARQEGRVVVAGPPQLSAPMSEAFKADTGIDIAYISGGIRDLSARFDKELDSGTPTIDVKFGGASDLFNIRKGLLEPVQPMLVLPTVLETSNWKGNELGWLDNAGQFMLQPNEYVSGLIVINKEKIDTASVNKWSDLLRDEFKGKIATEDPAFPGAGQAVAAYLLDILGADFISQLYLDHDVRRTTEGRQLVEWVVRGDYPIAFGAISTNIERYRDAGIDSLVVKSLDDAPGYIVGGYSVAVSPKNLVHPNAAAVFYNWYFSQRGQQIFADYMQVPSRRIDVDNKNTPEYAIPSDEVNYVNQYHEDWYTTRRNELRKTIREMLGK